MNILWSKAETMTRASFYLRLVSCTYLYPSIDIHIGIQTHYLLL